MKCQFYEHYSLSLYGLQTFDDPEDCWFCKWWDFEKEVCFISDFERNRQLMKISANAKGQIKLLEAT